MKGLKINGQPVQVPTSWDDVKYKDFKKHLEIKDGFDLVAHYLKIDVDTLRKCTEIEGYYIAENCLSFIVDNPLPPIKKEFVVTINEKVILFPLDLMQKTCIGQYQDMLQSAMTITKDTTNQEYFKVCEEMTSIYLQPILMDSDYDYYKIEEIKEHIENLTAQEIYSMGSFFLTDLRRLQSGTRRTQRRLDTLKHRFFLNLKRWMNSVF